MAVWNTWNYFSSATLFFLHFLLFTTTTPHTQTQATSFLLLLVILFLWDKGYLYNTFTHLQASETTKL